MNTPAQKAVDDLRARIESLGEDGLDLVFREARTFNAWQDRPVADRLLRTLSELSILGPTSANGLPARFVFIKSQEGKEKLKPFLMSNNVEKTMTAPVVAIIAYDEEFFVNMPRTFPHMPDFGKMYEENEALAHVTAFRNGSLQGGYFILAARSLGLDCGPMSGFDNQALDRSFFSGTKIKSNFLCNIGYGDVKGVFPRNPRLGFDEVCKII